MLVLDEVHWEKRTRRIVRSLLPRIIFRLVRLEPNSRHEHYSCYCTTLPVLYSRVSLSFSRIWSRATSRAPVEWEFRVSLVDGMLHQNSASHAMYSLLSLDCLTASGSCVSTRRLTVMHRKRKANIAHWVIVFWPRISLNYHFRNVKKTNKRHTSKCSINIGRGSSVQSLSCISNDPASLDSRVVVDPVGQMVPSKLHYSDHEVDRFDRRILSLD